jgi:hypothetical protein
VGGDERDGNSDVKGNRLGGVNWAWIWRETLAATTEDEGAVLRTPVRVPRELAALTSFAMQSSGSAATSRLSRNWRAESLPTCFLARLETRSSADSGVRYGRGRTLSLGGAGVRLPW